MSNKPEILLIDDNAPRAEKTSAVLDGNGFDVIHTTDAEDWLEAARTCQPALLLIGISAKVKGQEMCEQAKEDETLKAVPVVLITDWPDPDPIIAALEAGADDVLVHPATDEQVLACVRGAIEVAKVAASRKDRQPVHCQRRQLVNLLRAAHASGAAAGGGGGAAPAAAGPPQIVEKIVERVVERIVEVPVPAGEGGAPLLSDGAVRRLQEEFLANLTFDLLSPLYSVKGYLESLRKAASLNGGADKLWVRTFHNLENLEELLQDLMDTSALATGKWQFDIEEVDSNELIRMSISDRSLAAQKKGVTVQFSAVGAKTTVAVDKIKLRRALGNLLDNAIQFSPEAGEVLVTSEVNADRLVVRVADEGPGVPEDMLAKVFERFLRGAETEDHGGLGLGLYITKKIVEAHGGEVGVLALGGGSTFYVSLPLKK